jgi:hypothetical protein
MKKDKNNHELLIKWFCFMIFFVFVGLVVDTLNSFIKIFRQEQKSFLITLVFIRIMIKFQP